MHSFVDNSRRTWEVAINVTAVKRIRGLLGIDLYALVDDGFKSLSKLVSDPVTLADVLYCLCKDQADKQSISDEDFGRALSGDVITQAADAFVEELIAKGITYRLDSNIYLDIAQITDFSDLPLEMKDAIVIFGERGGDPERSGKRHPLDPLLWRESGSNEPSWSTSFGEGRPGWHIECNAISGRLRNGGMITLQGGGSDLIFPHHYMTMIQARARYGHDFAERYVHAGMIGYEGTKMSKSLGNLVFVSELLRTGVHPMAVRIALMMGHYREDREWTGELLQRAEAFQAQLLQILSMESVVDYQGLIGEILDHLSNDLNTPGVIDASARYFERVLSSSENNGGNGRSPGALSRFFDTVLGIAF